MAASSLQSHRNNAFTAIVMEMVLVSVMGQFDRKIDCHNGCTRPLMGPYVSFEITKNVSQVYNWSNCFPIHTELLSVCKANELYQFGPMLNRKDLFRKCTGKGWLDGLDILQTSLPNCVKKVKHCHSPPAIQNRNIFMEIQGRNFTIDDNYTSAYYSEGTIATYKCKDSKLNAKENKRVFRCIKLAKAKLGISEQTIGYNWTQTPSNGKDLVCDLPEEISVDDGDTITAEPSTTFRFKPVPNSNNEAQKQHVNFRSLDSGHNSLSRNLIIGICSFLGFVLIAVLFGVLFKNRTRIGQQYKDIGNHPTRPTFQSIPEEIKNQQDRNFANKEENYQYVNIIPIAVNLDTIYAEVETGAMDGYSIPAMTRHVDDDQTTVYAEIHH